MKYQEAKVDDILPAIRKIIKDEMYEKENVNEYHAVQKIPALRRGLLLKGITGSGKTHTLYAVRSVLQSWGRTTKVENWVKLLFEFKKDNFSKVNSTIETLSDCDYIFIDDIGAEKASDWGAEMMYLIINEAYTQEKVLFISTNLSDDDFAIKYGDRIASRLGEMTIAVEMPEKDWRIK